MTRGALIKRVARLFLTDSDSGWTEVVELLQQVHFVGGGASVLLIAVRGLLSRPFR